MKYLFKAIFEDGAEYNQTPEDISKFLPNKSAFTDVLNLEKEGKKLVCFRLWDEYGKIYEVNLLDGSFNINGIKVNPPEFGIEINNRRIIYFRRVVKNFNAANLEEISGSLIFFLGWQGNDQTGRNYKQTIEIQ